jgi:hypothetical protein
MASTFFEVAEHVACAALRQLGFDAHLTAAGADGGIDVTDRVAGLAVQVKATGTPVGRPVLQQLVGAGSADGLGTLACFSTAGFSGPAFRYADQMDVALFRIDLRGTVSWLNSAARDLRPTPIRMTERGLPDPPDSRSVATRTPKGWAKALRRTGNRLPEEGRRPKDIEHASRRPSIVWKVRLRHVSEGAVGPTETVLIADGVAMGVSTSSGSVLWDLDMPAGRTISNPRFSGPILTWSTGGRSGLIMAAESSTGKSLWQWPGASVDVVGGIALVHDRLTTAVDLLTGSELALQLPEGIELVSTASNVALLRGLDDDAPGRSSRRRREAGWSTGLLLNLTDLTTRRLEAGTSVFNAQLLRDPGNGTPVLVAAFGGDAGNARIKCITLEGEDQWIMPERLNGPSIWNVAPDQATVLVQARVGPKAFDCMTLRTRDGAVSHRFIHEPYAGQSRPMIPYFGGIVTSFYTRLGSVHLRWTGPLQGRLQQTEFAHRSGGPQAFSKPTMLATSGTKLLCTLDPETVALIDLGGAGPTPDNPLMLAERPLPSLGPDPERGVSAELRAENEAALLSLQTAGLLTEDEYLMKLRLLQEE